MKVILWPKKRITIETKGGSFSWITFDFSLYFRSHILFRFILLHLYCSFERRAISFGHFLYELLIRIYVGVYDMNDAWIGLWYQANVVNSKDCNSGFKRVITIVGLGEERKKKTQNLRIFLSLNVVYWRSLKP